jgi:hypothetical protein
VQILKTKKFDGFCQDNGLNDDALAKAIKEFESGLVEAELGAQIVKKRVARDGGGKSGGYRTIIFFKLGKRAIFMHGFPKNVLDNIDKKTLENLKALARAYNKLNDSEIAKAISAGIFVEVKNEA